MGAVAGRMHILMSVGRLALTFRTAFFAQNISGTGFIRTAVAFTLRGVTIASSLVIHYRFLIFIDAALHCNCNNFIYSRTTNQFHLSTVEM